MAHLFASFVIGIDDAIRAITLILRGITVAISRKPQRRPFQKLRKHQRRSNAQTVERFVGCIAGLYGPLIVEVQTPELTRRMHHRQDFDFLALLINKVHDPIATVDQLSD